MALADQLSIRLVVAFSEATQPLTLTSEVFADSDQEPFEIFCAIATTTCDQFVSVRTATDHIPAGDSADRSRSTTHRATPRDGSSATNGDISGSQSNGDDRNVRRRTNSERPPSASRPRLSMSDQAPTHISNSVPTGQIHSRTTSGEDGGDRQPGNGDTGNPLFLPGGSQRELEDAGDDLPQSQSQRARLSQAEVEQMSGLGDLDEVMEAMDDEQHEEELEEMRASQVQLRDDHDEDEEEAAAQAEEEQGAQPATQSGRPRAPLADITMDPDESVLFPPVTQQQEQRMAEEEERTTGPPDAERELDVEKSFGPSDLLDLTSDRQQTTADDEPIDDREGQAERVSEEEQEQEQCDRDEPLPPTQIMTSAKSRDDIVDREVRFTVVQLFAPHADRLSLNLYFQTELHVAGVK